MSDSISEKLKEVFDIFSISPATKIKAESLVIMEPDCLIRNLPSGRLAKSIANFGILNPILVNCNNIVLDGKKRLEAAISLGMELVPVKRSGKALTVDECQIARAMANPHCKTVAGFGDALAGRDGPRPIKKHLERARRTAKTRASIDLRLQQENKIYESSLVHAALHAVHSIGCIDAVIRNTKGGHDYLEKARKLLEKAIRYTVYSGVAKEKNVVSSNHERATKDSQEKEESDSQDDGSVLLEFHETGSDLRHAMRGFGAFPGL